MKQIKIGSWIVAVVMAFGAVRAGAQQGSHQAQPASQTSAAQRAQAVKEAMAPTSPAKRPMADEDIKKYCAAQTEIVRAKREDLKAERTLSGAEARERERKFIEKSGLTMEEYTFFSLRMNQARLYSTLQLCPDAMKADCELYKKHKEAIAAALKAE